MKIVFFGSDDFAALHLQGLLEGGYAVAACVTGPDKPQGRGMKMGLSPIKELAMAQGIPCLQPMTLKDHALDDKLKSFQPDIFVVVAYGRLLTQEILDIPKFLCVNVHGSLLPKYRGAAPINWAILNGEKETGVTLQKMALKLDAGEIIAQEKMLIGQGETAAELRRRMAQAGAKLLIDTLKAYPSGNFPLKPQDEALVTYAPKLTKEMGKIDWGKPAASIANQVCGLAPWPGAYTFHQGKMVKILRASSVEEAVGSAVPGQVVKADKEGIYAACGQGCLLIKEVQPQAGKVMPAGSFMAGYRPKNFD